MAKKNKTKLTPIQYLLDNPLAIQYLLDNPLATPVEVAKATGCTTIYAAHLIAQRGTPRAVFERVKEVLKEAEGRKDDTGKLPWHLLPGDAIEEIVKVLRFGANKYSERNWEAGMVWSRPFSALMRHMWAWWQGEDTDKETGLSHLAHAGCCLLFLLAYEVRNKPGDDRPKETTSDDDKSKVRRGSSKSSWMYASGNK